VTDETQLQPGWSTYKDEAGEWRWRYVSPHNGNILADSGEGYENEGDAEAGMDAVKLAGAVAVSAEHPIEPTVLEAQIGPELPDPMPSPKQAALDLAQAYRSMNVAEQNLAHATDENAERFAKAYVEAEQRLNYAITVNEAIIAQQAEAERPKVDEQ
jgi:uncharacterized protein YegP (UPF0339 family)